MKLIAEFPGTASGRPILGLMGNTVVPLVHSHKYTRSHRRARLSFPHAPLLFPPPRIHSAMTSQVARLPSVEPPAVAASPERHPAAIYEKSKSHWSDASSEPNEGEQSRGEREKKVASGASGPHSFLGLSLPSRATADARRVVSAAPTATAAPHVHRQAPGYGTPARTPAQAIAARAVERDSLGGEFISLSTGTSRPIPHSDGGTEHAVLDPVPERPLSIASASSLPRDKASRILG